MAASAPNEDRYTIITADSHAGGSHAQYREFLEEKYLDDFDAWRAQYKNPYKDLAPGADRRLRNWDDEMRNGQQDADGVVGEVIFPNTVPPFFPGFVLFAAPPKPEDYEHRLAGIRAHNRWLVDFCNRFPERRAGIGQIFMNDIDDAIDDVRWIKEHGLRGGVLIQPVPPDAHEYIRPLNDPEYDRLWAVCQDLDIPIQSHGGVGSPSYPNFPSSTILHMQELGFYTQRTLNWMILSGVFERFPRLKFVLTEQGGGWVGEFGQRLDALDPEQCAAARPASCASRTKWRRRAWRASTSTRTSGSASASPVATTSNNRDVVAEGHWMWGSDFPHDEATTPFTREHLRISMQDVPTEEKRKLLAGNAAAFYDFDLAVLDKAAAKVGPTVAEIDAPLEELPDNPNMALLGAGNTVGRAR